MYVYKGITVSCLYEDYAKGSDLITDIIYYIIIKIYAIKYNTAAILVETFTISIHCQR